MKIKFSRQVSEKYWNINFLGDFRPGDAELFHAEERTEWRTDRQTGRRTNMHDEANSRFPQVHDSARKWVEAQIC